MPGADDLPRHDEMSPATRVFEALSIAAAIALLALAAFRLALQPPPLTWHVLAAIVIGAIAADFASGVVHWIADTWGSESMPVLGLRLIRPFRVHHVNPRDFLRRNFVDCNGDVALVTCPFFAAVCLIPLSSEAGQLGAVSLLAFATTALPTNQVHQWAHQSTPPRVVGWLQRAGLILGRAEHARHHTRPHVARYCIATGWCNRTLDALGLFPALERAISRATGLEPRQGDREFADEPSA